MKKLHVGTLVVVGLAGIALWAYVQKWTGGDTASGVRVVVETTAKVVSDGAEKAKEVAGQATDALLKRASETPEGKAIAERKSKASGYTDPAPSSETTSEKTEGGSLTGFSAFDSIFSTKK